MNYKLALTRTSGVAKRTFWTTWLRTALTETIEACENMATGAILYLASAYS